MGASSSNVPAIMLVTGPMLAGSWRGEKLGACTDCRRFWARYRAGEVSDDEINEVNGELAPTIGTCGVMGRSEEHTSELQSLMRISYAVFCLKKKNIHTTLRRFTT